MVLEKVYKMVDRIKTWCARELGCFFELFIEESNRSRKLILSQGPSGEIVEFLF